MKLSNGSVQLPSAHFGRGQSCRIHISAFRSAEETSNLENIAVLADTASLDYLLNVRCFSVGH